MKILDIVDMQNSFLQKDGLLSINQASELVIKANDFFSKISKNFFNFTIVKMDTHFELEYKNSKEGAEFPNHCFYQTKDWDLSINVSLLQNKTQIFKLYKNVFDMWDNSQVNSQFIKQIHDYDKLFKVQNYFDDKIAYESMQEFLTSLNTLKVKPEVYLFGVSSDYCVKYAIQGYLSRGFIVNVIEDLTKGIYKEIKDVIKEDFANHKNIKLINSYQDLLG